MVEADFNYIINNVHPDSIIAKDRDKLLSKSTFNLSEMFEKASSESGRTINQMRREVKRCNRGPGQLTRVDYIQQRLYELNEIQQSEFISNGLLIEINEVCNDSEWHEKVKNKWSCSDILSMMDIVSIPTIAMVDRSDNTYSQTIKIDTTEKLRTFLNTCEYPLFAKPNELSLGLGAFIIESLDGDNIIINGGERISINKVIDQLMGGVSYILQKVVLNHSEIRKITAGGLAPLRIINLVGDDESRVAAGILRLPIGENITDSPWLEGGNVVANINVETGVIDRVTHGSGLAMTELTHHPDTNQLILGTRLPYWGKIITISRLVAKAFSPIKYQALDIAITDNGPVVIEINAKGSFVLTQRAAGCGFLTPRNKTFFESCGVDFGKLRRQSR